MRGHGNGFLSADFVETTTEMSHLEMKDKINRLLEFGDPHTIKKHGQWPDYLQYGFTDEDIPTLIELVTDPAFDDRSSDDNVIWVPLHAWRILGQLKSTEAIQPLIEMFDSWADDDWAIDELPKVIGMIGSSAIKPLAVYSKEKNHPEFALIIALDGLKEIAIVQPELRIEVLDVYRQYMLEPDLTMGLLNGLIMASLLNLKATELIDEIRKMFSQDCVDISVAGDLEDIEIDLGLRIKRTTPKPNYGIFPGLFNEMGNSPESFVREKTKIGRNDHCLCGSGKKYKKCCLH